jgi:hypothetical protein
MGYLERDIQLLARKLSVFKASKESKAEKQVRMCVCLCVCEHYTGQREREGVRDKLRDR